MKFDHNIKGFLVAKDFYHDLSPRTNYDDSSVDDSSQQPSSVFTCTVDHSGATVHVKGWLIPAGGLRPIVFVHDLGEEIALYEAAALQFRAAGYPVYGFDLRGHGQSGRRLGHVPKFQTLVNDLLQVVAWVRHRENGRHPVIVGHGLGALVAIYFHKSHPKFCAAVVLSAIPLSLKTPVSRFERFLIRTLAEIYPTMKLPVGISPRFTLSPVPAGFVKKFLAIFKLGGYRPPRISCIFARELIRAVFRAKAVFLNVRSPALILRPLADEVCDYSDLDTVLERHHQRDLISILDLENVGHSVFNESDESMKTAVSSIVQWIAAREAAGDIYIRSTKDAVHPITQATSELRQFTDN